MPPRDLTAILLPKGQRSDDEIRALAATRGDVLLRVAPLDAVGLVQLELCAARTGLPSEDPDLVAALSAGGRAAFVHVNHSARQALVHPFSDGKPGDGWAGAPGTDLESRLRDALGVGLDALHDADDGTRLGIGAAASRTVALVRGRALAVPAGTPTTIALFQFHDAGRNLDGERLAFVAFDADAAVRQFAAPAAELAAHLTAAPPGAFGPLEGARAEVIAQLAALGGRQAAPSDAVAVRAFELCALHTAVAFSAGEAARYWDERVLPVFSLGRGDPAFAADELEELEDADSVLHAMVETLPWSAPPGGEGALLSTISDAELAPLVPWVKPGDEYAGALVRLEAQRLLPLVRALDGETLSAAIGAFVRAWYRAARPGLPEGDALAAWERAKADEGRPDFDRFLSAWAGLRAALEVAAANRLQMGLLFYEGA